MLAIIVFLWCSHKQLHIFTFTCKNRGLNKDNREYRSVTSFEVLMLRVITKIPSLTRCEKLIIISNISNRCNHMDQNIKELHSTTTNE